MPLLRARWHPYTSAGVKRGVGGFVCDCGGKRFSKNPNDKTECEHGEAGQSTQPPRSAFDHQSADFRQGFCSAKCPGRGQPRGSILKRDKFLSHLPAVRTVTFWSRRERRVRAMQKRPVGADAYPFWVGQASRPAIRTTNKIPKAEVREALLSLRIDFCRPNADQYAQKSCYKS